MHSGVALQSQCTQQAPLAAEASLLNFCVREVNANLPFTESGCRAIDRCDPPIKALTQSPTSSDALPLPST